MKRYIRASRERIIPKPFDRYYQILPDSEILELGEGPIHPSPCEECEGYDVVSYAYLIAKPEYADEMMANGIDYTELISEDGGRPFVAYVVHDRIFPVLEIDLPDEGGLFDEENEELLNSSTRIQAASDANLDYWYLTKHGLGPGMMPRDVNLIDVVEVGWDTYILLDRVLTTRELNDYDIKEATPPSGSITHNGYIIPEEDYEIERREDFRDAQDEANRRRNRRAQSYQQDDIFLSEDVEAKCNKDKKEDEEGQQIQGSEDEINRKYYEEMKSRGKISDNEPYYDWMDYTPVGKSDDFKSQELADEEDYYDFTHGEGDYSDNSGRGDLLYDREYMSDQIAGRLGLLQRFGAIIYDWYDAEGAWEDFNTPEEFLEYLDSDIYSMLDACDDQRLKEEVNRAINSSTNIDGASQPVEGMSLVYYKDYKIMPNSHSFCWEVLDDNNELVESGFKSESEAREYIDLNSSTQIQAADEQPLDPPDPEEPTEEFDTEAEFEVELDTDIVVDEDGEFDFLDESYSWADGDGKDGDWYEPEYNIKVTDAGDMSVYVSDLLASKIPSEPGTYNVKGQVTVVFNIEGIEKYEDYQGNDEDGDPILDETYKTEYATIKVDENKSKVDVEFSKQ